MKRNAVDGLFTKSSILTLKGGGAMKKLLFIFLITLIAFPLISCTRVKERAKGELKTVKLKKLDAIPIEYGSLVGATANPEFPSWAQLWFEDDERTIRVVSVGFFDQIINKNVTVIPRN